MKNIKESFSEYASKCIINKESQKRFSTAHLYRCALSSFSRFLNKSDIPFSSLSRDNLVAYGLYLKSNGKHQNTISTYMRMLRSIYNRAVDENKAPYIHRQFYDVYTGVEVNHKRVISTDDIKKLLFSDIEDKSLRDTQYIATLLFGLCGIPFVDLAHLQHSDIKNNILSYNRTKTGTCVRIGILSEFQHILHRISLDKDDYILPILSKGSTMDSKSGYMEYQKALSSTNRNLRRLASSLGISNIISTYTFRHSWATTAKYIGIPIEQISEMLGHKSITTTQTYLKAFNIDKLTETNKKAVSTARCFSAINSAA